MNLKEIFDKSRELWSIDSQLYMLAEESIELAKACFHVVRQKRNSLDHLAEEIADTQFLIDEMLYYFKLVPKVAHYRKLKEEKLEALITGAK